MLPSLAAVPALAMDATTINTRHAIGRSHRTMTLQMTGPDRVRFREIEAIPMPRVRRAASGSKGGLRGAKGRRDVLGAMRR